MSDLHKRIAGLSARKRELLRMLLEEQSADTRRDPSASPQVGQSSGHAGGAAAVAGETLKPAESAGRRAHLSQTCSSETKSVIRHYYDSISDQLDASIFGEHALFLNYGYRPGDNAQYSLIELPEYCLNKNSIKLTLEVIGDCDLTALDILDVGSGRGGTVQTIEQYFKPRLIVGLDLSASAVSFCRAKHTAAHTCFLQGDAESLPFLDQSFDIVTNIESSHNYTDIHRFYNEVRRVLRHQGYFLYADNRPVGLMDADLNFLRAGGFAIEREQDITPNVLSSCDEAASRRFSAFQARDDDEEELLHNFMAVPGSQIYEDMKQGKSSYRIYKLRKQSGSHSRSN